MFDEIVTLVKTTGFPIACVICLAMYIRELNKTHKEEINAKRREERRKKRNRGDKNVS